MSVIFMTPLVLQQCVIAFTGFSYGECFTVIECHANMKPYGSETEKTYKDTIIVTLNNGDATNLFVYSAVLEHM